MKTVLSDHHKLVIASMIRDRKTILKGQGQGLNIKRMKNKAWQEIYDHVVELGGIIPSLYHLRKVKKNLIHKWRHTILDNILTPSLPFSCYLIVHWGVVTGRPEPCIYLAKGPLLITGLYVSTGHRDPCYWTRPDNETAVYLVKP